MQLHRSRPHRELDRPTCDVNPFSSPSIWSGNHRPVSTVRHGHRRLAKATTTSRSSSTATSPCSGRAYVCRRAIHYRLIISRRRRSGNVSTSSIKLVSPRTCYTYITRTVLADSPRFRNVPAHCATDCPPGAIGAHRVAESCPELKVGLLPPLAAARNHRRSSQRCDNV